MLKKIKYIVYVNNVVIILGKMRWNCPIGEGNFFSGKSGRE